MKDQIRFLLELHGRDLKIQACRDQLDLIQPELSRLETEMGEKSVGFEAVSKNLTEQEQAKLKREKEVEELAARMKQSQSHLPQIKTNQEYQAALKEIADTKKISKAAEDQILEIMTQLETLKAEKDKYDQALKSVVSEFEGKKQEFSKQIEDLNAQIKTIEREKEVYIPQVKPEIWALYQRLQKARKEAMGLIDEGTCQACYMKIPPQLYLEIQKLTRVHACPSCNRILYLAEWQGE